MTAVHIPKLIDQFLLSAFKCFRFVRKWHLLSLVCLLQKRKQEPIEKDGLGAQRELSELDGKQ